MIEKTYQRLINTLKDIENSGLSILQYYNQIANKSANNLYVYASKARKDDNPKIQKLRNLFLSMYDALIDRNKNRTNFNSGNSEFINNEETIGSIEEVDNDQQSKVSYERDNDGNIKYYQYQIFKKNKPTLQGRLTREEMNNIYRLYTYYGDNLTGRTVSRFFPELSLPDFKRILRAFNIYKDSAPFAPHMFEECAEEELREMQIREKENSFLRKAEEDRIKNNEILLRKYASENIELKKQIDTFSNLKIDINEITPYEAPNIDLKPEIALNLYLADVHLGAAMETGSLYKENTNYGFEEAKRRLSVIIDKLVEMQTCYDVVNVCLLGDNIDCCGKKNYTASLTHEIPENMDAREQFNKFIELYDWFIRSLIENNIAEYKINVFSVPTGNHGGSLEFALNKTLKYYTETRFPNIKFTLFDQFFGVFKQNGVQFCITHGKNDQFMKKGMPLNLDDKNKVKIYEWLDDNKIYGDNIHIIKGDLHSNNMNSCKRFSYRNVLSLFGASDYSAYGFGRNSYGLSYDLIIGNNVVSGTFENI